MNQAEINNFKRTSKSIVKNYVANKNKEWKWPPALTKRTTYGVGSNTYRAYRDMKPYRPSVLYREWAHITVQKLTKDNKLSEYVSSKESFEKWHKNLARSLELHWIKTTNGTVTLSFPHKMKLIDLFIKWLSRFNFNNESISNGFILYAHAALDSKILEKMQLIYQSRLELSRNPKMGCIKDLAMYKKYQKYLLEICSEAGSTPLIFDFYAWNEE